MPRSSKRVKASRTNGASNAVTFAMLDDMNISVIDLIQKDATEFVWKKSNRNYIQADRLPVTYTTRLPLDFVQKAFMYCLRFMSGYREGLVGPELDFAVKKYRGHRSIPVGQVELIKAEFEKKHERKASGCKRKR